jgi:hypothetical protein
MWACRVGDSLNLQFDPARVLLFDAASGERLWPHCRQRAASKAAGGCRAAVANRAAEQLPAIVWDAQILGPLT